MDYEDKAEEKKPKKEPKQDPMVKICKGGVTIFRKESLLDKYLNDGWQVVE